jgi:hypothetical protein
VNISPIAMAPGFPRWASLETSCRIDRIWAMMWYLCRKYEYLQPDHRIQGNRHDAGIEDDWREMEDWRMRTELI